MLEAFDRIDRNNLLNTDRLKFEGKAVMVAFWSMSSARSLEAIQSLKDIYDTYRSLSFDLVSVHTPEFDFEKDKRNVLALVREYGINYPVVVDSDYFIWTYFNNQSWPAYFLLDNEGELVNESFENESLQAIAKIISGLTGSKKFARVDSGFPLNEGVTLEAYLGKTKGTIATEPLCDNGNCDVYRLPETLQSNRIYLNGRWNVSNEFAESLQDSCELLFGFKAAEANIVVEMAGQSSKIKCEVDDGEVSIEIPRAGVYNFYKARSVQEKTVKLKVPKGTRIYSLTFG